MHVKSYFLKTYSKEQSFRKKLTGIILPKNLLWSITLGNVRGKVKVASIW
jgi:hypothetical protein